MDEKRWLACDDPRPMRNYLQGLGPVSDRKLRLFALACCRHVCLWARDTFLLGVVDAAERSAAGMDGTEDRAAVRRSAGASAAEWGRWDSPDDRNAAGWAIRMATERDLDVLLVARQTAYAMVRTPSDGIHRPPAEPARVAAEAFRKQAGFLRDIFGSPHRPVSFDPGWLSTYAVGLATSIDADRGFDAMPVLGGDALEEAGCDDAEVLAHCRSQATHVRGCWVVDGLLGKTYVASVSGRG
jgi:hypothetical protein